MIDEFQINGIPKYEALIAPVTKAFEFTPSETIDETRICRAVQANTTGAVKVMFQDDTTWTNTYVLQGVTYSWRLRRISVDSVATLIGLE